MLRRGAQKGAPARQYEAFDAEDSVDVDQDPDVDTGRRAAMAARGAARGGSVRGGSTKGLGRRSLDALRVGVLVLDADDYPVLANPAARELGLLRAGSTVGGNPVA